ncbi:MAG: purine-nucleoside phosphorylase [Bacteroidia bacterium]|jgi:purine-nucleoside phosphorylase|nr:purine-nucleoside phosphorylase [Bacteroidia bacterium]
MNYQQQVNAAVDYLRSRGIQAPEAGIILGTGLGNLATEIVPEIEVLYSDIPHFPEATVEFHAGKLIYGTLAGRKVLALKGRFHFYEGYTMQQITLPVRVMKLLGVKWLFISNAAGGMNTALKKGDLMLIDDHINLQPGNPLIGANVNEWGPRFPDMSRPYSPVLNALLKQAAAEQQIALREGVYVSVPGPNLETRAEYRFLHRIGADAVGMSTVPEVIAANHGSLPCAAISVITDECDPDNLKPVDIAEIIEVAGKAELKLTAVFKRAIELLPA